MKVILTSTGFDNKNIEKIFINLLNVPVDEAKALFIPTALNTKESREYVHVFMDDLLNAGIKRNNIDTYDLDAPYDEKKIIKYDVMFFCPGSPEHLLSKIKEMNFYKPISEFLANDGIYFGVSAGSDIAANNLPNNLRLIDASIETHAKVGSECGVININDSSIIKITDNQAIIIDGKEISIVE